MITLTRRGLLILATLAGCLLPFTLAAPARADSLAEGLMKQAPKILKYAREQGYTNIGVLKFRVKKGSQELSDSAGTLNTSIADRLETALLVAQDLKQLAKEGKQPIGIIADASAVAKGLDHASYRTEKGREKLFAAKYPLRWGKEKVKADAFVTGVCVLPRGKTTMEIALVIIGKDGKTEMPEGFEVDPSAKVLIETGKDFLIRGTGKDFKKHRLTTREVLDEVVKLDTDKQVGPVLESKDAPVVLEVQYSTDKDFRSFDVIDYQIGPDKTASIPEPPEGTYVRLVAKKVDNTDIRYGVVLKVNGENTLFRETVSDLDCTKWILHQGFPKVEIYGYRVQGEVDKTEEFRIAAPEESEALEVNYGKDVGQISFVVFRDTNAKVAPPEEARPEEGGPLPADFAQAKVAMNLLAVEFGRPSSKDKPVTPEDAQIEAKAVRRIKPKGLIVPGEVRSDAPIEWVTFDPEPVPVLAATITYYKPKKAPF